MKDHRVRLDDIELAMVVSALKCRVAGLSNVRSKQFCDRLAHRLAEHSPGNPWLIHGWTDPMSAPAAKETEASVHQPEN